MLRLNEFLENALSLVDILPDLSFVHSGKRVLVIGFTPQWISYMSLVSTVLIHRGCVIDFLWTPVFEHDNADRWETAQQLHREVYPVLTTLDHPKFRPINIDDLPLSPLTPEQEAQVLEQAEHDTIHAIREVRLDIAGRHRAAFRRRLHILQEFAGALETLFRENEYDVVLTPNGQIFEWGIARRLAVMRGLPVCTLETFVGGTDFQICTSWTQPAVNWNTTIVADAWAADEPHVATDEVKANVKILMGRFDDVDDIFSHQFVQGGQVDALRDSLRLDPTKPVVLVMPSLGHEKHNRLQHRGYKDHVEWFEEVVRFLAGRTDCNVVIRSHPFPYDAKSDPMNHGASGELPECLLASMFERLPDHFRFIGARDDVNTYDVLKIGDFVVTHHSTVGLETALIGRAAVACSTIHYADKGFTFSPQTKDEYIAIVDDLIRHPERARLTPRQVELAQCFVNVFYFKWPDPFPWHIMRPLFRHPDYPLRRVLSLETILGPMMDTFDRLVSATPISDEVSARQVDTYMGMIRNFHAAGELGVVAQLLGPLDQIDLAGLARRRPTTFAALMEYWEWAALVLSQQVRSIPATAIQDQARRTLAVLGGNDSLDTDHPLRRIADLT
ncbi:hypothetical protein CU669_19300 [Paramagnetospirillum kuznetsovii]|uniref:Capsule polysaccharide biosynthesis protein n=1 Tax=Paramagnetospirillum kuznetsovii TaxID=2053833 RepID=A0A364NT55_9PROT|nr:hypothetical protein [Paramagnetospirillum kuznetsovii]RAU20254.1 hypothetical protein CU669_19300 [Paramagnetospirillum kuznetsovii]